MSKPDAFISVSHGSELSFVYGVPADQSPSAINLSNIMVDYWVSFATSLDPNDRLGNARKSLINHNTVLDVTCVWLGPIWAQYTPQNEVCFSSLLS